MIIDYKIWIPNSSLVTSLENMKSETVCWELHGQNSLFLIAISAYSWRRHCNFPLLSLELKHESDLALLPKHFQGNMFQE